MKLKNYLAQNKVTGLYWSNVSHAFDSKIDDATILDPTQLAVLRHCYENVRGIEIA
jgi:hypothetical protein